MLGHDGLFSSLAEWIRVTTAYFANRTDCWFIVRAHPGETIIGTGQPVTEIIRNHLPDLPSHVRVIGPDAPVNTYDLMEFCHFGITYTSITGLEMAMRGIPVVVSARPHYSGKGFTKDVNTTGEYFDTINELLAQRAKPRLSERQVELAWCYANVFYFDWAKPFPWHRATFWDDIEHWPITRVLSSEGSSQFDAALDLLVDRVC
jgi:capsule polysaccharide export protein KpsC/LpsZ